MHKVTIILIILGVQFLVASCARSLDETTNPELAVDSSDWPQPKVKRLQLENPTHILFVGNSYLYYGDSVHNHVRRIAIAAGIHDSSKMSYKSATIGGAAIFDHNIDHLLNPENLRVDKPFEVVILQGGSAAPLSEKRRMRFMQTTKDFAAKIKLAGGETVLYMTHSYVEPHARYRPGMIKDIASLYVAAGNKIDALVIPVGLAFEEAYRLRPNLQLHKSFDGSHPNLAGTYLASATVFASIYGISPVGNSYDYYGAIDPQTMLFFQTVAQNTVKKFYGRN
jgi:hypothetical protein